MVAGIVSIGVGVLLLIWGVVRALPVGGDPSSVTPTPASSVAVTAPSRSESPRETPLIEGESGHAAVEGSTGETSEAPGATDPGITPPR